MNNINQIKSLTGISTTADIIRQLRSILEEARRVSVRAVNNTMVFSYWLIGKRIVIEEQQGEERAAYGEQILKNLSRELTQEFGEGFSYANLKKHAKILPNLSGRKRIHAV